MARDVARLTAWKKGQVSERTRLHIFRALHQALEVALEWSAINRNV